MPPPARPLSCRLRSFGTSRGPRAGVCLLAGGGGEGPNRRPRQLPRNFRPGSVQWSRLVAMRRDHAEAERSWRLWGDGPAGGGVPVGAPLGEAPLVQGWVVVRP